MITIVIVIITIIIIIIINKDCTIIQCHCISHDI